MTDWRAQKTRHMAGFSVFLVAGHDFHFSDSTHAHLRQIASDGSQTGRDSTKCLYGLFAAASISASSSTNSGSSRIES